MSTAIYARKSRDDNDTRVGVDRQVAQCSTLAATLAPGAPIVVYVDNDVSGHDPNALRPDYDRLVADIRAGLVDRVVTWEQSRLTRRPDEWERLLIILDRAGIGSIDTVQGGPVNIAEGNRLISRITSVVDAEEAERAKIRARAAHRQLAAEGRPQGGVRYGYRNGIDGTGRKTLELDDAQAVVVRDAARRVLAGESITGICADLTARGVPTARGGDRWRPQALAGILRSPTTAGLRAHHGEIVGPARWQPVLDRETWEQVINVIASRTTVTTSHGKVRRVTRRGTSTRRWLLGGFATCGRCGSLISSSAQVRRDGTRIPSYGCSPQGGDPDACRGVSISSAEDVDAYVAELIFAVLDPAVIAARLAVDTGEDRGRLVAVIADAEQRQTEAAEMFGAGELGSDAFRALVAKSKQRADDARRQLSDMSAAQVSDLPPLDRLADTWAELGIKKRRAVVELMFDAVVIVPRIRKGVVRGFDPDRIQVKWRV